MYQRTKKLNLMSQVFRFPEALPKDNVETPSTCKSVKLMLTQGYIKPTSPGIFNLMPLALRSLEKLCALVDLMMTEINGQKVLFPSLTQDSLLQTTNRWNNSHLFKLKDRNCGEYCLSPTHEEVATSLLAKIHISYKSLPICFYQISTKFRDEMNPKLGLLRGREFIMKDMYSFDFSDENAIKTYNKMCNIYQKFFSILGVEHIKVRGSSGDMGGNMSHEFHFLSDVGEDNIFYCPKCKTGINSELFNGENNRCVECDLDFHRGQAIEVGHAFLLGTTYTEPFGAKYNSADSSYQLMHMGCYGLGLTRILASCIECLSTAKNIRWPKTIAPYLLSVITPKVGSKEESVKQFGESLANSLNNLQHFSDNVILDDRANLTIGRRVMDASELGIPYVIVIGKPVLEEVPKIEVIDVYQSKTQFLTHQETMNFFKTCKDVC